MALTLAAAAAGCGTDGSDDSRGDDIGSRGDGQSVSTTSGDGTATTESSTDKDPTTEPETPTTGQSTGEPTTVPADGALVVIDPGHNGANGAHPDEINRPVDAGGFEKACNTVGSSTDSGIRESSIDLELAQALRDRLAQSGVEVVLTRDSDDGVGPCVDQRGRAAADAQADLLVSLHADGAGPELSGFHVIHPGLRTGYTDQTVEPSAQLAADVRDALVNEGFTPATYVGHDGLHQRDDLGTLNLAGVPAVMLEAGNLRNASDASVLTSPDGQSRLTQALATAILTYLP